MVRHADWRPSHRRSHPRVAARPIPRAGTRRTARLRDRCAAAATSIAIRSALAATTHRMGSCRHRLAASGSREVVDARSRPTEIARALAPIVPDLSRRLCKPNRTAQRQAAARDTGIYKT